MQGNRSNGLKLTVAGKNQPRLFKKPLMKAHCLWPEHEVLFVGKVKIVQFYTGKNVHEPLHFALHVATQQNGAEKQVQKRQHGRNNDHNKRIQNGTNEKK